MELNEKKTVSITDIGNFMDCRRRGVLRLTNWGREAMDMSEMPVSATKVCGILAHDFAEIIYDEDLTYDSVLVKNKELLERQIRYDSRLPDSYTLVKTAHKIGYAAAMWAWGFAKKNNIGADQVQSEVELEYGGVKGRLDFLIMDDKRAFIVDLKVGSRRADSDSVKRYVHQMAGYRWLVQMLYKNIKCVSLIIHVTTADPDNVRHFLINPRLAEESVLKSAETLHELKEQIEDVPYMFYSANVNSIHCNRSSCPFYDNKQLCPETFTPPKQEA